MIPIYLEEKIIKYLEFIAKNEVGCAPSCGYFEEIILKARQLLEEKKNDKQLKLF